MALLNFTLSEEGVAAFRDALICLNKFSDDVSLEARKDSVCAMKLNSLEISLTGVQFVLTTLNTSKSAYANFRFATTRFFSRYQFQGSGQFRERFYCTLYIRVCSPITGMFILVLIWAAGTYLTLPKSYWSGQSAGH